MAKFDRYDWIGTAVAAFVAALWIAHVALPPAPPDPNRDGPALGSPALGGPALGGPGGAAPFVR